MITVAVFSLGDPLPGYISKHYIALFENKRPSSDFFYLEKLVSVVYVTIVCHLHYE